MSVKVGVIGVGNLGQHHARIISRMHTVKLAGIADINTAKAGKIAQKLHVPLHENYQSLFDQIDAAVIAVPTVSHYKVARDMLSCGIHCLVEKPITETMAQAEDLVVLASQKNLILQIGHVERFNPAVLKAREYINRPQFIEVNRLGPYDPRTSNIGVVLDLMIHDLDMVLSLIDSPIESLESIGAKLVSRHEDIAKVRLRFKNKCIADLSASRITLDRYRKIRIFQADSYISIDYMSPSLKIYTKKMPEISSLKDLNIIKPKLPKEEPLKNELEHFISCVQSGKRPAVSGEHGRDALELAIEILNNMKFN
ncbi:MAG: Gfo/Idh/MocA family oxidoreductase [bacterium]